MFLMIMIPLIFVITLITPLELALPRNMIMITVALPPPASR
jgi:hypothetical protein